MKQKQPKTHLPCVALLHSAEPHSGFMVLLVVPGLLKNVPVYDAADSVPVAAVVAVAQPVEYMNGGGESGGGPGGDGGDGGLGGIGGGRGGGGL